MTRSLPKATNRRAVLGGIFGASALAASHSRVSAADTERTEPELQALIAAWRDAERQVVETCAASCAAGVRALCPVPQALIATDQDASFWNDTVIGRQYREGDVARMRNWKHFSGRFDEIFGCQGYDDRLAEIIDSWDNWQLECRAAEKRERTAEADGLHKQAVERFHASGRAVAQLPATTMAGVIAKLLAAASLVFEEDLENPEGHAAILAGAALDAKAIMDARTEGPRL